MSWFDYIENETAKAEAQDQVDDLNVQVYDLIVQRDRMGGKVASLELELASETLEAQKYRGDTVYYRSQLEEARLKIEDLEMEKSRLEELVWDMRDRIRDLEVDR